MGYIRITTYKAAAYLVQQLWQAGTMHELIEDGGDIVLFKTPGGQKVSIHMIESHLPVYEIRNTLEYNAKSDTYTLFLLWARMMLPHHAQFYEPEDWMDALIKLYGGHIYGYDMYDGEVFLFPVNFRGDNGHRYVEYGTTVHPGRLTTRLIDTALPDLKGTWRVATLDGDAQAGHRARMTPDQVVELDESYVVLGVSADDDKETVKKAYRLLARRYHPDSNKSPEATEQMQRINTAYQSIMDAMNAD